MSKPKEYKCAFPGCTGGCHVCAAVKAQVRNAPFHAMTIRVLSKKDLDPEARQIVEWARNVTRPRFDIKKGRWLP